MREAGQILFHQDGWPGSPGYYITEWPPNHLFPNTFAILTQKAEILNSCAQNLVQNSHFSTRRTEKSQYRKVFVLLVFLSENLHFCQNGPLDPPGFNDSEKGLMRKII